MRFSRRLKLRRVGISASFAAAAFVASFFLVHVSLRGSPEQPVLLQLPPTVQFQGTSYSCTSLVSRESVGPLIAIPRLAAGDWYVEWEANGAHRPVAVYASLGKELHACYSPLASLGSHRSHSADHLIDAFMHATPQELRLDHQYLSAHLVFRAFGFRRLGVVSVPLALAICGATSRLVAMRVKRRVASGPYLDESISSGQPIPHCRPGSTRVVFRGEAVGLYGLSPSYRITAR